LAANADNATFVSEIGRTKGSAQARIKYINDPSVYRAERERRKSLGVRSKNKDRFFIPDEVVRDAESRRFADRNLTSLLCGDPAPGQSALDRRQTAGVLA
jgi:hypothetical protein